MFDVVTFGSAVSDNFVETKGKTKDGNFNYKIGSKILINDLKSDIGGGGTNTAVAFSRLGLNVGCICKVGNDIAGKEILNLLRREKVTFIGKVGKGKTGYSIILDSRGEGRTILTYKGESNNVSSLDIKGFETKWLYYSSLLDKSFETQKSLALRMTKKGVKLAFNPSQYLVEGTDLRQILEVTDVLVLNKEEARILVKRYGRNRDLLKSIYLLGPKIVVVTDKNNPIECYDGSKRYSLRPHSVKVVERTGAGDAFASGFVAGIITGRPIQKCLELGLEEGEAVLGFFGAKNNLIRRKLK